MEEENPFPQEGPLTEPEPLPFPFVSVVLLIAIVVVFIAMLRVGQGDVAHVASQFGDKENNLIRDGQWWRLITPIFLHGGWGHLIANGLTLLLLGIPMERIYGARKFFLIYMLSGIAGYLFSFWFSASPSLGASGALYGLMGAGLVFPLRYKKYMDPRARRVILTQLGRAALINVSINFLPGLHLDKWAHIGGMAGGCLAALIWIPDVLEEEPETRAYSRALWSGVGGMLLLLGLAVWQQTQAAHHNVRAAFAYYVIDSSDPWWGISLPANWRKSDTVGADGSSWRGPYGTTLKIIDSKENPDMIEETKKHLAAHKTSFAPSFVDGKQSSYAILKDGNNTVELHQIIADDRVINIWLFCPTTLYPQMKPTFDLLLNTVRFVRPPHKSISLVLSAKDTK